MKGSVSKIFGAEERKFLEQTLSDSRNGIQGYRELQRLMFERFGREFAYVTLVENPAEKVWQKFKRAFANKLFESIEQMKNFISEMANSIDYVDIMSICKCSYI